MKYSILTPTHDRADVLPFAVRSVIAQTETDWELFIVGDGCTHNTAEVVAKFSDPRIRWLDLRSVFFLRQRFPGGNFFR